MILSMYKRGSSFDIDGPLKIARNLVSQCYVYIICMSNSIKVFFSYYKSTMNGLENEFEIPEESNQILHKMKELSFNYENGCICYMNR